METGNLAGTRLGKYELRTEIGRGGMGSVYKAFDPSLDRFVAVKILAPHMAWETEFVERFLREARAAARLRHPSIVTIHDVGQEGGWYYYAMEYLEGQTLAQLIRERGPMAVEEILVILRPLAEALDYAHGQGLIHRDIKPSNVIIGPTGRPTLTDFGIARAARETRLTSTGAIVGTPEYMSPEQVRGTAVDKRSDQYSLGVVAYEMLAGEVPFQADSTAAMLHMVVYEPPPPLRQSRPDLSLGVEDVLRRSLAKEPGERFGSCIEFVDALERPPESPLFSAYAPAPPAYTPAAPTYAPTTPGYTPPAPTYAPPSATLSPSPEPVVRPRRTGLWIGLGVGGVLAIALCAAAIGGAMALPSLFGTPTVPPRPTDTQLPPPPTSTQPPPATDTLPPPPPTVTSPPPGTDTPPPPPTEIPIVHTTLGRSVQGRNLDIVTIGGTGGPAVVVIGSIQGDQQNTRALTNNLIDGFERQRGSIPPNVALHFIPTINPDGNLASTRRNANNVDLNRNWDTFDWTPNPEQPGGTVNGAGGSRPLSEPETKNLADYLLALQRRNRNLRVVLWHSSARLSGGGQVYPGYTSSGLDPDAVSLARRYVAVTGYALKEDWAPYETTGELITWCAENGISAIDVVIPRAISGSEAPLRATTMEALLEVAQFP